MKKSKLRHLLDDPNCYKLINIGPPPFANFKETIEKFVKERYTFICKNREKLIEAWVAETGALPSEIIMCQQDSVDGVTRIWLRKMTEEEKRDGFCHPEEK